MYELGQLGFRATLVAICAQPLRLLGFHTPIQDKMKAQQEVLKTDDPPSYVDLGIRTGSLISKAHCNFMPSDRAK